MSRILEPAQTRTTVMNVGSEEIPEITTEEIRTALKQMKNRRCQKIEQQAKC